MKTSQSSLHSTLYAYLQMLSQGGTYVSDMGQMAVCSLRHVYVSMATAHILRRKHTL